MKHIDYFQWLPGTTNEGEVVSLQRIINEDGDIFYEFNTGDICNEKLIADYTLNKDNLKNMAMVRIASPIHKWEFRKSNKFNDKPNLIGVSKDDETLINAPSYDDFVGSKMPDLIEFIPPRSTGIKIDKIDVDFYLDNKGDILNNEEIIEKADESRNNIETQINISKTKPQEIQETVINNINDPVAILVNSSTKHESCINMELNIDLPAKSLFNIAKDNFDNGADKFIDVILNSINYECVKESLREALLTAYSIE